MCMCLNMGGCVHEFEVACVCVCVRENYQVLSIVIQDLALPFNSCRKDGGSEIDSMS